MTKPRPGRPRIRLFVALDLPESFLERLSRWREATFSDLEGLRLLSLENLHVTLVFLGYQYERDLERVREAIDSVPARALTLRAEQLMMIGGSRRRGRALAVSIEDREGALGEYQGGLSAKLQRASLYEPERRAFWPHLTFARGKAKQKLTLPEGVGSQLPDSLRDSFRASRLVLYQSILHPAGARYRPLHTILLE